MLVCENGVRLACSWCVLWTEMKRAAGTVSNQIILVWTPLPARHVEYVRVGQMELRVTLLVMNARMLHVRIVRTLDYSSVATVHAGCRPKEMIVRIGCAFQRGLARSTLRELRGSCSQSDPQNRARLSS